MTERTESQVDPRCAPGPDTAPADGEVPSRRPFAWGPLSSAALILALLVLGRALGMLAAPYLRAARTSPPATITWSGLWSAPARYVEEHGFEVKDAVVLAFVLSSLIWIALQRRAIYRFFRSMWTGVSLVALTTVAIVIGVLVPQLEGFEDPDLRVTPETWAYHYGDPAAGDNTKSFRHAESYFLYHLQHLYGIGMPAAELPPGVTQGLDRFGRRYGSEERKNREKRMEAAFRSQPKMREIGAFADLHDGWLRKAFAVCTYLELNRVYKSSWFAMLLVLLGIGIACNTFKGHPRTWFRPAKLGFLLVHGGMLTILVGGFVSKMTTERGLLDLTLDGGPRSQYARHNSARKTAELPFDVELEHFARKEWLAVEVTFADERFSSLPPRYTLWPGRVIDLDYPEQAPADGSGVMQLVGGVLRPDHEENAGGPRLRLVVRETHDRAQVGLPHIRHADPDYRGRTGPVVELQVPARAPGGVAGSVSATSLERIYLTPADRRGSLYVDPARRFRLLVADSHGSADTFPADDDRLGVLAVLVAGHDSEWRPVPIVLGRELELSGGFRLRFERATQNYTRAGFDPRPLVEQPAGQCAVQVLVSGPRGDVERRTVFEGVNAAEVGDQEHYRHREVLTQLVWGAWTAPGPPRFVLDWGPGHGGESRGARLVAQSGESFSVRAGVPLELPGDTPVVPLAFYERAVFAPNLRFLPPTEHAGGWDPDFYSTDPRGLVLDIVFDPDTERERVETARMASTPYALSDRWSSEDGRVQVRFLENVDAMPQDWRSVLAIWESDADGKPYKVPLGDEAAREIRVNDYFRYGGWRFFQTNADTLFPNYSGIGVVYDPGIPIVLTGMYTVIAGAVLAFLVRPILRARRGKERAA